MKDELVVVAGAGGFIGGHLVADLLRRGHRRVRAVDVKELSDWHQRFDGVENLQLDLSLRGDCTKALAGASSVYNLAADMGGMGFIENNKALCMLTVLINTHLLLAAREAGVSRYFYASSACVYNGEKQTSPDVVALKESDAYPALPEDGYGWEKLFSRADVPPLPRGLRDHDARRAFSQRLRAVRNLGGRPRKGARRDLPEGDRRQDLRQARDRDLGGRHIRPAASCTSTTASKGSIASWRATSKSRSTSARASS